MVQYKMIFFGKDEVVFLDFMDRNWDRIIDSGYAAPNSLATESFEYGFYARYAKASVETQKSKAVKKA